MADYGFVERRSTEHRLIQEIEGLKQRTDSFIHCSLSWDAKRELILSQIEPEWASYFPRGMLDLREELELYDRKVNSETAVLKWWEGVLRYVMQEEE